jgi:hypothetical protein
MIVVNQADLVACDGAMVAPDLQGASVQRPPCGRQPPTEAPEFRIDADVCNLRRRR